MLRDFISAGTLKQLVFGAASGKPSASWKLKIPDPNKRNRRY
jgi:hypothetical protein